MRETLTIDRLGRQGDGVALRDGEAVHVPFALPGETVSVAGKGKRARLEAVLAASPSRQEAICRHFGTCGGCRLQHFEAQAYRAWKREMVVEALVRAGIETPVAPLVTFPVASRRRAVFSATRTVSGTIFGFQERDSNRIVDLADCPILLPELAGRLDAFRTLCGLLAPRKGTVRLTVLACGNGLDLAAECEGRVPDKIVSRAIALAGEEGFARLSLNGEILAQFLVPALACGSAMVTPPPGGFAQAVGEAETAMAGLVLGHLAECRRTADLFSGFGAFALRLAANSEVHAAEFDAAALAALDRAWRETGGALKRVTTDRRDLFRRPMTKEELAGFDGAVFDPPRAGAEAQVAQLAGSGARRIAAVSCNPVTLARDLRVLLDGGYRIVSVTPVDQFVFTAHVEAVALLQR
ncbi:MAG: RNA methyltransferase [Pseudomonadota bacterium]|nr:RNA methyltransferase [Pseudomonadota bacterium]